MRHDIWFTFPHMPESVNAMYRVFRGRPLLSAKGKAFRNAFVLMHGGADPVDFFNFSLSPNVPYCLEIWFGFPRGAVINETFGQDKRVKSWCASVDTSNRIKLAEDCIAQVLGMNDRQNWSVLTHKRVTSDGSYQMVAWLHPLEQEAFPLPALIERRIGCQLELPNVDPPSTATPEVVPRPKGFPSPN